MTKEISAREASRLLGVNLMFLYTLLWSGKLAGRKSGKRWMIPISAVQQRINANKNSE